MLKYIKLSYVDASTGVQGAWLLSF